MGARALASATISFGLVSIPVKLFTTSESGAAIRFNMLHGACGSRLKQKYTCPRCDADVAREEMVKGYEFAKGQFVTFAPEELKALEEAGSQTIEIHEFLPLEKIDSLFFEKAYYMGPDRGGDKPYRLLGEAMQQTGRAALASYAARGKQYLVLIRPFEDGLLMQQLRYADEIKAFDEVERGDAEVKKAELALAVQLIEQISADAFRPEQFEDTVRARIEEAVRRKVDGDETIAVDSPEETTGQIIDLMEALKASLGGDDAPKQAASGRKGPRRVAGSGTGKSRAAGAAGKRTRSKR